MNTHYPDCKLDGCEAGCIVCGGYVDIIDDGKGLCRGCALDMTEELAESRYWKSFRKDAS